ncbi:MAG: hypothetical protein HOU81_07690 [Hamadaea sp.]|uniref:hypothetical protein n=1 Tax=Hamadaea sp. TaxID=2024425 RepID=UPI0017CFA480|nr:hypothetical protein [Hamadaea sp.]NUR70688.1 hypothetical protein [Hamadaea sp.]NUT17875.1 hypothetical protein [Hamadaea sp.]
MPLTQAVAHQLLRALPSPIGPGLTGDELRALETRFGFRFNPDHRTLLAAGVPGGSRRWPDWRGSPALLGETLAAPIEGVLFDVEENGFWLPTWGIKPSTPDKAVGVARRALAQAPTLVPVYGHRYAPALDVADLPIFSVMQTDVTVYGDTLADYLFREFGVGGSDARSSLARVPFWSALL